MKSNSTILVLLLVLLFLQASGQTGISFTTSTLAGVNVSNPTVLAFGPDNRLYVTQQDGTIYRVHHSEKWSQQLFCYEYRDYLILLKISRITMIGVDRSQVLCNVRSRGLSLTGTAANPVLYICSSDPRIGGGGELGDIDLDTNSGMISKLTKNGSTWTMVHVVTGLTQMLRKTIRPTVCHWMKSITFFTLRKEEIQMAGSPSNNFGFLGEYALSAAILEIDLDHDQQSIWRVLHFANIR